MDHDADGQFKCNSTFPVEQKKQLVLITGYTGFGSAVCCTLVVAVVLVLRLYKRFAYRLTLYWLIDRLCCIHLCTLPLPGQR